MQSKSLEAFNKSTINFLMKRVAMQHFAFCSQRLGFGNKASTAKGQCAKVKAKGQCAKVSWQFFRVLNKEAFLGLNSYLTHPLELL